MIWNQFVRIVIFLGMVALLCGTVSAGVGIIAETHDISGGAPPVCSGGCECISESTAAMRWGSEGYERCSKTVCGQSPNAMIQYYCIRPMGGAVSSSLTSCQSPCECLTESGAAVKWGSNGYTQCTKTVCARDETSIGGVIPLYCYRPWGSTLVIGGPATTAPAPASTLVIGGPATTAPAQVTTQAQVQAPAQTQAQQPVQAQVTVTPPPSYTWPAANAVPQRTPVGIATIIAAIGAVVLIAAGIRRK